LRSMDQFSEAVRVLLESQFSQDAKAQAIAYVNEVSSQPHPSSSRLHQLALSAFELSFCWLAKLHATAVYCKPVLPNTGRDAGHCVPMLGIACHVLLHELDNLHGHARAGCRRKHRPHPPVDGAPASAPATAPIEIRLFCSHLALRSRHGSCECA
jgi:hypothetical protein